MATEKENLRIELRRELEAIGLTRPEAEKLASRQLGDGAGRRPEKSPPQHVVPVSRGWLVIRDVANLDVGLFDDKEAAIVEARKLAKVSGAKVIVHDD